MLFWCLLWCSALSVNSAYVTVDRSAFVRSERTHATSHMPDESPDEHVHLDFIEAPPPEYVDLVYLYVNGSDPEYQRLRQAAWTIETAQHSDVTKPTNDGQRSNDSALASDNGELLFSLRSMTKFFQGKIRKVFLVTETPPVWLNKQVLLSGELEVINPHTIMPQGSYPNFNSRALESNLHKIKGLGEYYMTLNDDVYLGRPTGFKNFMQNGVLNYQLDLHLKFNIDAFDSENEKSKLWNSHRAAMKNANRLLDDYFGSRAGRGKVSHSPLFWNKAFVTDAHNKFREAFRKTSSHIFRSTHDVHPGYLYAHYMLENSSIKATSHDSRERLIVFPGSGIGGASKFCHMISDGEYYLPRYFSVNDHMSAAQEHDMKGWIRGGLHILFPDASKYEDVSMHNLDTPPPQNFCRFAPRTANESRTSFLRAQPVNETAAIHPL